MKQLLVFALLSVCCQIDAQSKFAGGFDHVIDVCRYTDWGKDYLTISDVKRIGLNPESAKNYKYYHITYDYVDECKTDENKQISIGCQILEVDGVSAKGWSADQFYQKTDNRHDVIKLKIRKKTETGIVEYVTKLQPLYELPDEIRIFGNDFAKISCLPYATYRQRTCGAFFEERIDKDFDFFPCLTYDYLIVGNDPLLDKEILEEVEKRGMKRDEINPDIVFTIARDAQESINTTYIPPSSRIISETSSTTSTYNKSTGQTNSRTIYTQNVKRTPGYTKTTTTLSTFLEIAALDAKKINDPKATHAPVVWQISAKRNTTNPTFKISDELKTYATWMDFPILDRIGYTEHEFYAPVGVVCSPQDPLLILEVIKGSRAEQIGLMPGDKVQKVDPKKLIIDGRAVKLNGSYRRLMEKKMMTQGAPGFFRGTPHTDLA